MIRGFLPVLLAAAVALRSARAFATPGGARPTTTSLRRDDAVAWPLLPHIPGPRDVRPLFASNSLNSLLDASAARHLAVAGRIPWRKLLINKTQALKIVRIMRSETHFLDLLLVFVLATFPERIGKLLYEKVFRRFRRDVDYEDSIGRQVQTTLKEAANLAVACYFIDALEVTMEVTGLKGNKVDVSSQIAKLIYATWAALKAKLYKRQFFEALAPQEIKRGKHAITEIFDKVIPSRGRFFFFGIMALIWIDILGIKPGVGVNSIFALGGAGTFALTLATQDLAKKALNGLALSASDSFSVGDKILLGDGTSGKVVSIGWLSTTIRGSDELLTKIPNTQLSNVRVSNRSRMKFSQVKQELRFKYEDLEKIPDLIEAIKDEIAASCPKVVRDGSRPFRVRWTDYAPDHARVKVDCRLRNSPSGEAYYEARQGILEAIARAARSKGVEFAVPTEIVLMNE
ncbi:hypothetical protein ACHAWF_008961 [Thalassiosira exigua]